MKRVLAFNGSPRPHGNTAYLLEHFNKGAGRNEVEPEVIHPDRLNLEHCTGCLRCNLLGRCSISGDDWEALSAKILDADVLVFATPVYFHHLPAPLKKIIDRFRSFVHVRITETGLTHTPRHLWNKDFVLILTMGSSDPVDANPIIDLFKFMTSILGPENRLHVITGTRLAVVKQVTKSEQELTSLYKKLELPVHLAKPDFQQNKELLQACENLGIELTQATRL